MIGKRLAQLRKEHNLTQKELADKFDISPKAISFYELDQREPSNDLLKSFADFFDVTTDYLLGKSNVSSTESSQIKELEEDFPEGVSVLYRANKDLTPEQKEMMLRMINSVFFDDEEK